MSKTGEDYKEILDQAVSLYLEFEAGEEELNIKLNNLDADTRKQIKNKLKKFDIVFNIESDLANYRHLDELPNLYKRIMANANEVPREVLITLLRVMGEPKGVTHNSKKEKIDALKNLNTFIAFYTQLKLGKSKSNEKQAIITWLDLLKPSNDNKYEMDIKNSYLIALEEMKYCKDNNRAYSESEIFSDVYNRIFKDLKKTYIN